MKSAGADLIPKLRSLYCRVPLGGFSRTSWSTRPEHRSRFAVRAAMPINPKTFLASLAYPNSPCYRRFIRASPGNCRAKHLDGHNHKSAQATMPCIFGEQHCRYGNINPLSIAYATRLGLGPTNPEMITMAQETLLLRPT